MSYNLRCADDPNGHSIAERAPRILDIIKDYDPDVMGFQEVVPKWMEELKVLDDQFDHLLQYRHPESLEGTPIFWRKDRFECIETESFWLSETPIVPSQAGWRGGFGLPRVCCRVTLRHKESGKLVHYFNTHYDGGAQWEREASQQIIRKAEALPEGVRIATADFNFTPNSFGWHSMRSYFNCVRETLALDNNQATLNCYEVQGDKLSWVIDFCFYQGALQPTKYEIITRLYDGKFPSDQYGMVYDFKFED